MRQRLLSLTSQLTAAVLIWLSVLCVGLTSAHLSGGSPVAAAFVAVLALLYAASASTLILQSAREAVLRLSASRAGRGLLPILAAILLLLIVAPINSAPAIPLPAKIFTGLVAFPYFALFVWPGFAYAPYQTERPAVAPKEPVHYTPDFTRWRLLRITAGLLYVPGIFVVLVCIYPAFRLLPFLRVMTDPAWADTIGHYLPITTGIIAAPGIILLILTRSDNASGWRLFWAKTGMSLTFVVFSALMAYCIPAILLPAVWNAITRPPFEERTFVLVEVEFYMHRGRKAARGYFARSDGNGMDYILLPRDPIAEPGDIVAINARWGRFGATNPTVELRPQDD